MNNDQKPQTNETSRQKSPSIHSMNNDEKQLTNGTLKQKSPSFQSMNDAEAHYTTIFDQLDPYHELELHRSPPPLPPQSSTSRPKTGRGRQDQSDEHNTKQAVEPLIGLDSLENQTARSNDQQNLSSLPSTTTDQTENRSRRQRSTNRDDEDN